MVKQELEANNLEESLDNNQLTNIFFPRPLLESEALDLVSYFISQLEEESQDGTMWADLHISKNLHFGQRESLIRRYESIHEVIIRPGDCKIGGTIHKFASRKMESASFQFRNSYDNIDRPIFTGLNFDITPGYEVGELSSDSTNIMRSVNKYAQSFFKTEG